MSAPTLTPQQIAKLKSKVSWRIIPYVFVLYIIAFLDRANVGFAKLAIQADLKFSEEVFATGAAIFFIGYLLLEIPGAMIVDKGSARKWFARILISWGICTALVGLVKTADQFYWARFFLGVAEAGFYPGLIVYFSHWFPTHDRGRALAWLITAIPIANLIGAPLSGWIIESVHWMNLASWRWVFILEGIPAVVFGFITLWYFTDRPRDAKWLTKDERDWLTNEIEEDKIRNSSSVKIPIWKVFYQPNVLILAFALFAANAGSYVFGFWLPDTIKGNTGMSPADANYWTALPYVGSLIVVLLAGYFSDRSGKRKIWTIIWMCCSGLFLALSTIPDQAFGMKMLWLCLAAASIYAWPPSFWVLPSLAMSTAAAAVAVGFINSLGNLGGYVGPKIMGKLEAWDLSKANGLQIMASLYIFAAILITFLKIRNTNKSPDDSETP